MIPSRGQLQALVDELDDHLNADRSFFRSHPGRRLHIRRPFVAEVAIAALTGQQQPPDYVVVQQITPGVRIRLLVWGRADPDVDWDDRAIEFIMATATNRVPA